MIARRLVRWLVLAFLVCVPGAALSAQAFEFPGIPWGTPGDSARARLEVRGFVFQRTLDAGDQLYLRGDSAWLRVNLRAGRVVGLNLVDRARGEQADARYGALADSLRAALGQPDEEVVGNNSSRALLWVAGLASVDVSVNGVRALRRVELEWLGPGWHDEMARRREEPPLPAGFTLVSASAFLRIAIDTTGGGLRGAGGQRGRFRIEYRVPVAPTLDGVPQDTMDTVEYEMDIDCAGRRTRLVARTTYLAGRRLGGVRPEGQPWTVPQPDGHYARGRDALCRARRGRR